MSDFLVYNKMDFIIYKKFQNIKENECLGCFYDSLTSINHICLSSNFEIQCMLNALRELVKEKKLTLDEAKAFYKNWNEFSR